MQDGHSQVNLAVRTGELMKSKPFLVQINILIQIFIEMVFFGALVWGHI